MSVVACLLLPVLERCDIVRMRMLYAGARGTCAPERKLAQFPANPSSRMGLLLVWWRVVAVSAQVQRWLG